MKFAFDPKGYVPGGGWRPLRLRDPKQRGWDVFDLQCRLAYLGRKTDCDGFFGPQTDEVVRSYQDFEGLEVDGIAGVVTQSWLGAECAAKSARGHLARRVLGQMQKESSLLCGIYTAPYTNDSRDRGPVQMNSQYHPDPEIAFDVARCLPALVERIKIQRKRYLEDGVADERAWAAGQGHWNSPVLAGKYAHGGVVPESFLSYLAAVTAFV